MSCYTREQIESAVKSKGYKWFENGDLNVNIVGVRNDATEGKVTNKFDDCITLSYKVDGEWCFECFKCTTDPGDDRGSHKLRLHQGKYLALGQQKPVKVYRDKNTNGVYDFDEATIQEGLFGINIHRATKYAGRTSTNIDKWSAGCQVIASNDDWVQFLGICQAAREEWSNNFTYTLINSNDIA